MPPVQHDLSMTHLWQKFITFVVWFSSPPPLHLDSGFLWPAMSIAKLPFLATGLVATYSIQTAPNPYVPASKRPKDVGTFERIMSSVVPLNVVFVRVRFILVYRTHDVQVVTIHP